ncbi:unnamed protein product [Dovyalis caffra]|uniref:Plant bHLH transcription factor ACT-like domain-containing protein n=1 Tax=Dovyalis caffra TaxID=77055 RepID=A0AAV1SRI4_9ROSI|nr:unnamed protein product [Dovyalis caffra]
MNDQTFNYQTSQRFSSASFGTSQVSIERPAKQPKTSQHASPSSSSDTISFHNSNSPPATTSQRIYGLGNSTLAPKNDVGSDGYINYEMIQHVMSKVAKKISAIMSRSALRGQDHVLAERKRREMLSQRFIALSAVVPGLKKVSDDEDSSSTDVNSDGCCDQPLPEIETRVSDKDVLIRIHCEKQKECLTKILSEIEKLHLNVINSSTLSFGNYTLDVTVAAEDIAAASTIGLLWQPLQV